MLDLRNDHPHPRVLLIVFACFSICGRGVTGPFGDGSSRFKRNKSSAIATPLSLSPR